MHVVTDYEKDEVTMTLTGAEANDVMNALMVAADAFRRGDAPFTAAMLDRYTMLQAALWRELCELDPSALK
jgi:hypothetical protein